MIRAVFGAFAVFLGVSGATAPAALAAEADGGWTITIITDKGGCDRGYRYPVMASAGKINYFGDADIEFNGAVSPAGDIKAQFIKGTLVGNLSGKLAASSGSGTWSGKGGAGACSGKWQAAR